METLLTSSPNSSGNLANVSTNVHLPNLPPGSHLITINDLFGNDVVLTTIVPEPPILSQIFHVSDYRGFQVACSGGQNDPTLGTQPQGGTPGYQYLWSNGASTPNIAMLSAGVYTLTLTDAAGCSLVDQTSLQAPPPLNLYAQFINPNCDGYDTGIAQVSGANGGVPPYQFALENESFSTQTSFHDLLEGAYTCVFRMPTAA